MNYPMDRRNFIKTTGAAVAGSTLTSALNAQSRSSASEKPNILFIMTDQQHAGMMSCTGNPWLHTPAMDSLARDGVRLTRAYAANPVCGPSRISMATGMMPGRVGAFDNVSAKSVNALPTDLHQNSMGMLMKRAGYDTFYGGKVHMTPDLVPAKAGYDEYIRDDRDKLPGACVEFIQQKRNQPFFAVASFINPHDICFAYNAYAKRDKMMSGVNELYEQASQLPLEELPPLPDNFEVPDQEPDSVLANKSDSAVTPSGIMREQYDEREWRMYRWIYCRLTELVDSHIGQILDGLRESGQEDNTLVLFVSDHGDMDASHRLASKGLFYEESVGVPLLMRHPGHIPAGKTQSALINIGLDILPTFCDYAGIGIPDHLPGQSLKPLAEGKQPGPPRSYIASENNFTRMIRTDRFKYCAHDSGDLKESLYDMKNDPGEMHNLVADRNYKTILNEHRALLKDWVSQTGDREGKAYLFG